MSRCSGDGLQVETDVSWFCEHTSLYYGRLGSMASQSMLVLLCSYVRFSSTEREKTISGSRLSSYTTCAVLLSPFPSKETSSRRQKYTARQPRKTPTKNWQSSLCQAQSIGRQLCCAGLSPILLHNYDTARSFNGDNAVISDRCGTTAINIPA